MNFFEKMVHVLSATMERPPLFGAWHFVSLALAIALTAFMIWKFKDCSDKTLRRILFIFWIVIVLLEVYKQVVFSMHSDGVTAEWSYQWYAFPFQFCSTPIYLLPILVFAKDCKFRNAVMAYMVTFSLFAGLVVMIYPGDVFIEIIGINIQTMVHHGLQLVMGVFLAAHNRHHLSKRFFAWAMSAFVVLCAVALGLNTVMHYAKPDVGFNMFYISPFQPCTLPVLSEVYAKVPYPVFLIVYVLGFTLVAAIVYTIEKVAAKICTKIKHRND
jgi:uncharacterized membrane protein YwaF